GFSPRRIVYSGVGKRLDEIDMALKKEILMFNVESLEELRILNERGKAIGKKAPIALRVNPDVDPRTHPYISTGLRKNKFGVDAKSALEGYRIAQTLSNIRIIGIDCHIGSQITAAAPFKDAMESLKDLIRELGRMGIALEYLDMGGGLGIVYDDESPPLPGEYARAISGSLKGFSLKLILEPGRVIVGNAGILVTGVIFRKKGTPKEFIIVDAAMNDLIRPSLYNAFHAIWPVVKTRAKAIKADVVGPICESGDFLAQDRKIADVKRGDLMAVMSAGAYGFAMSSTYCSRPRIPEVMVKKDQFHVIRKRETAADLIRGESIPSFI
ncbi:MAG: diaminopimelate decarboxylase, partial [Thermodesulfobacteriota bacterium]